MKFISGFHHRYVHAHRVRVLCAQISKMIPRRASVLDVGCGDGLLANMIQRMRPDARIEGIDVLPRRVSHIGVTVFDGEKMPFPDRSFDVVMFVDVLHHTEDPTVLLREAVRVARQRLVIKDHLLKGLWARPLLRFMDTVSNESYGVHLPYNYWAEDRWRETFEELDLRVCQWRENLHLYPWPVDWILGRSLHFVGSLECVKQSDPACDQRDLSRADSSITEVTVSTN